MDCKNKNYLTFEVYNLTYLIIFLYLPFNCCRNPAVTNYQFDTGEFMYRYPFGRFSKTNWNKKSVVLNTLFGYCKQANGVRSNHVLHEVLILKCFQQGSPFSVRVAGAPDPSRVKVYGPGVEHGVLAVYQSRFICDTRGAGAGQLTVRIRGPKGNSRLKDVIVMVSFVNINLLQSLEMYHN